MHEPRSALGKCQRCKRLTMGPRYDLPMLCGVGQVFPPLQCSRQLESGDFPVCGYVDFWNEFDVRVLLCSMGCYNSFIQDPEEVILESQVNMSLWSSHLPPSLTSLMNITRFFSIWCVLSIFSRGGFADRWRPWWCLWLPDLRRGCAHSMKWLWCSSEDQDYTEAARSMIFQILLLGIPLCLLLSVHV